MEKTTIDKIEELIQIEIALNMRIDLLKTYELDEITKSNLLSCYNALAETKEKLKKQTF